MRKIVSALAAGFALCSWTACGDDDDIGTGDVAVSRASPDADFTSYRTFALADADDDANDDIPSGVAANLEAVQLAIADELEDRGLREVDRDDDPDLVAFSFASTNNNDAVYWDCVDGYWWGYWDLYWTPCAWLEPVYTEYTVGTIVLGLADPAREEVVFGGLIQGVEDDYLDVAVRIEDDVDQVFASYPADQTGG